MHRRYRILVVDDEEGMLRVTQKRLEGSGFEVVVALDGEEAIHKIQSQPPDLVVLDLMLPKRSGYEVCEAIKQDSQLKHIPIIMLTAKAQGVDRGRGEACGADAYMTKPYEGSELVEKINVWLSRSGNCA